jgi:membrane protease YdiL (CAAX protease family)
MQWVLRRRAVLEPVAVFCLIMAYIWDLRYTFPVFWLAIVGLMAASHWVHREQAVALGFQAHNLRKCVEDLAPAVILLALLLWGFGQLLATIRPIGYDRAMLAWAGYLPWGLLQQYTLNGYFLNRLSQGVSRRQAAIFSAALFSGAHLPNWFLMAVTLLLGYLSARIYSRYRNLYFLGAAHGTLGVLLYLVVPDSVSHHLVVGPGWFGR